MKKVLIALMCLTSMIVAGTTLKAQEVTVSLKPGWTWISYPSTDTVDFATALGTFIPMEGDMIKSQYSYSEYSDDEWFGTFQSFCPGNGYMYKSTRTMPVLLTFNVHQLASQVVTTLEPTNITAMSAVVGGIVTIGEGNHIFLRGVCWGTTQHPDIDGNHIPGEAVVGSQSITLDGLTPGAIYYVRAYAVTDDGLIYGEELSFVTPPTGAIAGLFSVSASQQVYFSQGNLQYIGSASTPYWKFADNQWDYFGTTTGQDSSSQTVDRDLFGWGTSGYNHGATCYQPWSTSENNANYNPYGESNTNLYDQTGQAEWGYNAISNGGNQENQWRTLRYAEWNYLLNTRSTLSGKRFAMAIVNNVNGAILLPDNWDENIYYLNNTNQHFSSCNDNIITDSEWSILEAAGAVFLPVPGTRNGTLVEHVGDQSVYWTSSRGSATGASGLAVEDGFIATGYSFRASGYSVRLVHDKPVPQP